MCLKNRVFLVLLIVVTDHSVVFTAVLHLFLSLLYCWQPFLAAGEECFIIPATEQTCQHFKMTLCSGLMETCKKILLSYHIPHSSYTVCSLSVTPLFMYHWQHSPLIQHIQLTKNITLFSFRNIRSNTQWIRNWICELFT